MARKREYEFLKEGIFSNYCGIGGSGIPQHATDAACKDHDEEYGQLQKIHGDLWPYLHWNEADERFLKRIKQIAPASAEEVVINQLGQKFFDWKQQYANKYNKPIDSTIRRLEYELGKLIVENAS